MIKCHRNSRNALKSNENFDENKVNNEDNINNEYKNKKPISK